MIGRGVRGSIPRGSTFWASLEHDIKYKKEIPDPELLAADLKECADIAYSLDVRMQSLRDKIL